MGRPQMSEQDIVSGKLTTALIAGIVLPLRRMQVGLDVTGKMAGSSDDKVAVGATEGSNGLSGRLS